MRRLVADDQAKRLGLILGQELQGEIGRDIIHPARRLLRLTVDLERAIFVTALTDEARREVAARALAGLLAHVELADVAGRVAGLPQQAGVRHRVGREGRVIVGDAVQVVVSPGQEASPAWRAERVDDERVAEPDALGSDAIEVRRLEPGEAAAVALFALHDAQGVPALVVGVDEQEVWARGVRGARSCGQTRSHRQDPDASRGTHDSILAAPQGDNHIPAIPL